MDVILSTGNRSKVDQIKHLLSGLEVRILSLVDAGIVGEVVEDGFTLEENAFKKANFARVQTGKWAIADDTGLEIDALDGKPGIHAARWAGVGIPTEEIRAYTLSRLKNIPLEHRTATFRTVAAIVSPRGEKWFFEGSVKGAILEVARCASQPNMPYSSIFLPHGSEKVWAEMTVEEENKISHRGKAFSQVREFLAQF